ncbi:Oidioi.mRNA.OKI2018_I69.XSR.g16651.t1.cds [Oikopleura dioica]|uniref:Oidioi.mRNA.OKI2018_I69.XSR.g16651.t1.cds n=1 Tax=Oikopleura dioica TaxID=34765 RepID=A0ABN7SN66_OIKDI|nr:Oidioi.mRNA.OKI2018_I69.XSR.g16651.t1.cds [Oikopleura dioica]
MTDRIYNQNKEWDYHPSRWTYGQGRTIFYPAAGGSDDWAHKNGINISYTLELRDKGRFGFVVPDTYLERTMKETAAGVSAVYDHVTRHDAVNAAAQASAGSSGGAKAPVPTFSKPSFVAPPTRCGDPAEVYGFKNSKSSVKYTPTFSCNDSGRCEYTCPAGSRKGNLAAVTCRPNKQFKPNPKAPMAKPEKFCSYALSVDNDTDFEKYCSKYGPYSNISSAWTNSNLTKNCKLLPRGTKIVCNFSCRGQRSLGNAKTFVKMTKNGVSAGPKKIVEPICSLAKSCN